MRPCGGGDGEAVVEDGDRRQEQAGAGEIEEGVLERAVGRGQRLVDAKHRAEGDEIVGLGLHVPHLDADVPEPRVHGASPLSVAWGEV